MEIKQLSGVLNKQELLDKVADYERATPTDIELGGDTKFTVDKENNILLNYKDKTSVVCPVAVNNLVSYIGFPKPYLSKIPVAQITGLVLPHLNYWYQEELAGQTLRLLVIGDNIITAIPKANFKHIKVSEVIAAIERVLGKAIAGYHKAYFGPDTFQFSVLTPREIEVKEGHMYNSGIRIQHSVTGKVSTNVAPYLFNQWCANGATTEHQLDSWKRRNQKEDIETWLQSVVTEASKLFDSEVTKLRTLCGIKVNTETSKVLDSVLEQSSVPQRLSNEVRSILLDQRPEDLYDIYQALTAVDTHSKIFDEHPNSRGILDKVAAHLASHSQLCPTCHQRVE